MPRLRALDLFSGIGGISLALRDYCQTVAYCEIDPYCQSVLLSRMNDGDLDHAPICTDVRALRGSDLPAIDIITGGFPCQDISVAGNGAGLEGKRSGLFYEVARLAQEIKPGFIFLENVPAITGRGLADVISEISALGYDCRWDMLSAFDVGAPHKRERWFLLAHSSRGRLRQQGFGQMEQPRGTAVVGGGETLAYANRERELQFSEERDGARNWPRDGSETLAHSPSIGWSQGRAQSEVRSRRDDPSSCGGAVPNPDSEGLEKRQGIGSDSSDELTATVRKYWWPAEPNVRRVAHGVPFRVDRIKGLGNSVCVPQAREAFERLLGLRPQRLDR